MVELLGYDRDAFDETVDSFVRRLHPEDRDRTLGAMHSAIEARGEFDTGFRVVLPSGEIRWLQGRGRVVADDTGQPARFLGAGFDITRQQTEGARVVRVLESMNAAFFSLDRNWRFDYVNAEAERLLLHSREDLIGGSIWELFPAAVGSDFETHYRRRPRRGQRRGGGGPATGSCGRADPR
jgi:PAS domain-containing protein